MGKLHKAIKSYSYPEIPHPQLVATRLAQCLQPDLPSGVHQKAIELYNTIFTILGDKTSDYISIWVPGILPLMSYASINVRPPLIDLYQNHILKITTLRNILLPLIYALLPGIDDESSESFDSVLKLIDDTRAKISDDSHFWQCFFLVVISSSERRLGALVWANRRLPKFRSILPANNDPPTDKSSAFQALSYEAQTAVIPETGLMVRAFCKGLEDEQLLVQRGFLELLVKNLELQSPVLQLISSKDDLKLLVISACSTVLRRDVSLNRRLWNWLLGPEPADDIVTQVSRAEYFTNYGSKELVAGLLDLLASDSIKAYKLCHSIMDRWEIGTSVIPYVLLPVIKSVKEAEYRENYHEILRSASAFFDVVEAINIWSDCLQLILNGTEESLDLFLFVLQTFNVQEEEMLIHHLPLMLIVLVARSPQNASSTWLKVFEELIELIPERAYLPVEHADISLEEANDDKKIIDQIEQFYKKSSDDSDSMPFTPASLSLIIQTKMTSHTVNFINEHNEDLGAHFCKFLSQILKKIPQEKVWRSEELVAVLEKFNAQHQQTSYPFIASINILLISVIDGLNPREIDSFISMIVKKFWNSLISVSGVHEVEAVKSLWKLQEKIKGRRIESELATNFVDTSYSLESKCNALSALWVHSSERSNPEVMLNRSIFLLLEWLRIPGKMEYVVANHWVEGVLSAGTFQQLLKIVTSPLLELDILNRNEELVFCPNDDLEILNYYFNVILILVKALGKNTSKFHEQVDGKPSYSMILKDNIIKIFKFEIPKFDDELFNSYEKMLGTSLELFQLLLGKNDVDSLFDVISLLLNLLKKFNKWDTQNLSQIRIIELVSGLLQQLKNNSHAINGENIKLEDLVECLIDGISSHTDVHIVKAWTDLLITCIPLFGEYIVQILLPLIECFCTQINKSFDLAKNGYEKGTESISLLIIFSYYKATEKLLIAAHDFLSAEENKASLTKSNNNEPGFFGAVMSGVFTVESPMARSTAANNRLTVLLCFQDVVKVCYRIWTWVEENSTKQIIKSPSGDSRPYHFSRLKFWTRKVMESLYAMETLETLEMFIEIGKSSPYIFKILHGLDGSKPKSTTPYLIISIVSRVNPSGSESSEKSSLTTELSDSELMEFLVAYLRSLENDAIEDIWNDCIGFLREVQANHLLYRHLLPDVLKLMERMSTSAEAKRKSFSDIFMRIFNLSLTSRYASNLSIDQAVAQTPADSEQELESTVPGKNIQDNLAIALCDVVPSLRVILKDNDKVVTALNSIVTTIIQSALKSKSFPKSFGPHVISLLEIIMKQPQSQKAWKVTVGDAILDQRFLDMSSLQAIKWKSIVSKWAQADKERFQDYTMARLLTHGSNSNVLFGWSDQESNNKQRNLARLSFIYLSGNGDGYLLDMGAVIDKFEEIVVSEPSLKADVYTCLRAIVLKLDNSHLVSIWTFVYTQLEKTFYRVLGSQGELKENELKTLISACKLLDTLLCLNLEDFKMHEWLFVCNSMEAIFKSSESPPVGVVDKIGSSGVLSQGTSDMTERSPPSNDFSNSRLLKPYLYGKEPIKQLSDLKPFFEYITIYAYESVYSMKEPDLEAIESELMNDLFEHK